MNKTSQPLCDLKYMKSENKIFQEQKNLENIRQLKAQMQKRKLLIQ